MQVVKGFLIGGALCVVVLLGALYSLGYYLSPQDKLRQADFIVAVSGGETDARTSEAVKLYQAGYAPKLLFSGAALDQSGPSNAAAMRAIALGLGVPASDIEVEEASTNTEENASNSASLLQSDQVHAIILVTSPYHQRRASIEFRRALGKDVAIINHSAPDQSWRRSHWWATSYSTRLTISELQKTLYVLGTKHEPVPASR